VRGNLRELSAKRPRPRAAVANVLYVVASIGTCRQGCAASPTIFDAAVGSLMRGIMLAHPPCRRLASLARRRRLRIVLNTRIFDDPVPAEARDLPRSRPNTRARRSPRPTPATASGVTRASWTPTRWPRSRDLAKRLRIAPPRSVSIEATSAAE
jgi:hypothetical protein